MATPAHIRWIILAAAGGVLAACSSGARGAGEPPAPTVAEVAGTGSPATSSVSARGATVLHAILPVDTVEGEAYAAEVARLSGGGLRLELESGWHAGSVTADRDAIAAVRTGSADIGIIPVRAWHDAGVTSFDALIAPMEIDSVGLEVAVLKDGLTADMIKGLDGSGLSGIGLLPGPIRRPAGISRTLTSPADLVGARIAVSPSTVAEHSLLALGATPVATPYEGAKISTFDGAEIQTSAVHGNDYEGTITDIVSNLGLWPRPFVIVAGPASIQQLSSDRLAGLRNAAATTIDANAAALLLAEKDSVAAICRTGKTTFERADDAALTAFRAAFAPTRQWLEQDSKTKSFLGRIDAIKRSAPAVDEAPACTSVPAGTSSTEVTRPSPTPATPLDGVWQTVTTRAEQAAFGGTDPDAVDECNFGTIRWTFGHGVYDEVQHAGTTQTWATGTYTVEGDRLTMDATDGGGTGPGGGCHIHAGDEFTWVVRRSGDTMTIAWPDPSLPPDQYPANYVVKPWRRVGDAPATVITTH